MKYIKFVLVSFVALLLAGCGGTKTTVSENWNWRPATIAVIFTNPVVMNEDDVEDDLPEYVDHFHDWMAAELKRNIESKATLLSNNSGLRVKVIAYPKGISGNVNFYMGESGVMFNEKDAFAMDDELALPEADAYLFIDAIKINCVLTGGGLGLIGLLLHEGLMSINGSYAFYDGKTHERIGFGTLEAVEDYAFGVSRSNWENLMENAVKFMFDGTPVLECDHCSVRAEANWNESKGTSSKESPKKSVWD